MKLGIVSIPTPRIIITKLPSPLKLVSSASSDDGTKNLQHEPLLETRELMSDGSGSSRSCKVPKGSIAVHVGPHMRRFVIPISFLAMPEFTALLEKVAEEYGCDHHGTIEIPSCDEHHFERILMHCFSRQTNIAASSKSSKKLIANMRRPPIYDNMRQS